MTPTLHHVALVGLPGAGKSTVGQLVGSRLGRRFVDLDAELVARTGLSIADQFALLGEPAFRAAEAAITADLATAPPAILAPGGGWLTNADAQAARTPGTRTIYLHVSPASAAARLARDPVVRPLVAGAPDPTTAIAALLARRAECYEMADATIDTDGRSPDGVADAVVACIRAWHRADARAPEVAA